MPPAQPSQANQLIADCCYDVDWFIAALKNQGLTSCLLPRKNRTTRRRYNKPLYRRRYTIEIMFGRLKDWGRIALRDDRCAHTFSRQSVSLPPSSSISKNES